MVDPLTNEQRARLLRASQEIFRGRTLEEAFEAMGVHPHFTRYEKQLAHHVAMYVFGEDYIRLPPRDLDTSDPAQVDMDTFRTYCTEIRSIVDAALADARKAAQPSTGLATTPHAFEGAQVRTVTRGEQLWFVATDVARVLGFETAKDAVRGLDADEKGRQNLPTLGGRQQMTVISEPGLYKLIARSSKPVARRFDRWVRHEVLPAIRKTGGYGPATPATPTPTPSMTVGRMRECRLALTALANAHRRGASAAELAALTKAVEVVTGEPYRNILPSG